LSLLSFFIWNPGVRAFFFGSASLELAGPLAEAGSGLAGLVEDLWLDYFALAEVGRENEVLKRRLARQTELAAEAAELRLENLRLKGLLDYRSRVPERSIAAKVVAKDPSPYFRSIVVAAGSRDGVELSDAVLSPEGAVGRVIEVSAHYARVLLLTDVSSGVDALIQRNRVNGLMSGTGSERLDLEYVQKGEDVRVGDLAVTSGLDGIFPPGVPVGTVTFVDKMSMGFFLRAFVSPGADFGSLEEVLVLLDGPLALDWLETAADARALYEKNAGKSLAE
jgi:rod shape-determining protein MreC